VRVIDQDRPGGACLTVGEDRNVEPVSDAVDDLGQLRKHRRLHAPLSQLDA
jgi:hypothetical protein